MGYGFYSSFVYIPSAFFADGTVSNLSITTVEKNERITNGSEVWMEVDLRSGESEKRTLHWFVNGRTQKVFFNKLPSNVQFGVCLYLLVYKSLFFCFSLLFAFVQIGWTIPGCDAVVDFISFEEMRAPSITPVGGSVAVEWK